MIKLLRNDQRLHEKRGRQDIWSTCIDAFGFLVAFDELRLPPGDSTEPHCDDETELVTYVYKGALSQEDTAGNSGVIHAGEFQRMSTGARIRHRETSVSRSDWVHFFRISLRPSQLGLAPGHEQAHFTAGQRRNTLRVVASPDGRKQSLRIHQDALIHSAILEPGHHFVHELAPERSAWLHLIYGKATLSDLVLTTGDGVGVSNERSISLTVNETTEILLVDLGSSKSCPCERASYPEDARLQPGDA